MNDAKRYDCAEMWGMVESPDGKYNLHADYERLREALEKYGEHVGWCTSRWSSEDAPKQCNCGLDDAIAGLPPAASSLEEADAGVAARKSEESSSRGRK